MSIGVAIGNYFILLKNNVRWVRNSISSEAANGAAFQKACGSPSTDSLGDLM